MNLPDAPAEPADENSDEDDVVGHRMLSPMQAQQRSDAARLAREQRLEAEEEGTSFER